MNIIGAMHSGHCESGINWKISYASVKLELADHFIRPRLSYDQGRRLYRRAGRIDARKPTLSQSIRVACTYAQQNSPPPRSISLIPFESID